MFLFFWAFVLPKGAVHRALAPHFSRPLGRPAKSSCKGSIANAGPVHVARAISHHIFRRLRHSFPAWRKIVQKKYELILSVKEKGLYICTPQTRDLWFWGSGKSSFTSFETESENFLKKCFAYWKKVVCLQPQKTVTLRAAGSLKTVFEIADLEGEKKLSKKLSKTLGGSKKGLYICTRLAIEFAERQKKQVH